MSEILVNVRGIATTPSGVGVFLTDNSKTIAIFVDFNVGSAITMGLQSIKTPRPLTHDLIANILAGLDVTVSKVVVNDLKDDTYYARLFLIQDNELGRKFVEIDSRPSDAIAIAIQQGSPIYVVDTVWAKAEDMTWALEQSQNKQDEEE